MYMSASIVSHYI